MLPGLAAVGRVQVNGAVCDPAIAGVGEGDEVTPKAGDRMPGGAKIGRVQRAVADHPHVAPGRGQVRVTQCPTDLLPACPAVAGVPQPTEPMVVGGPAHLCRGEGGIEELGVASDGLAVDCFRQGEAFVAHVRGLVDTDRESWRSFTSSGRPAV